ncbi:type 4a pilus biogenesis protein PilO [Pseudenhygromyxa sp. WMMC2535]|uniref:type 4a pilus biogenesis protein PilO n=1 Tax=Pseudenhygromyxa sp. WMMC2535 TaxID=2712867 RepID=UPI00155731AB|nr:type 4a pilus biogenesis protein PilO [Pseudenhygromyxa sp. WMMC2535]NVB38278.1 type 4a pilus biogenesis protein PilO [Pseudenhygromyxa sp. WMMC2535]
MADSRLDALEKVPAWQLALGWLLAAGLILAGWYVLYLSDTLTQKESAVTAVERAEADLAAAEDKLANYEQRVKEQAERDRELEKMLEVVPVDSSTIDHLMSTFQREARGVGLGLERWVPQAEERYDFYAKIPVEVTAIGTWHEIGEFFRRVSEMKKIVNIEQVEMKIGKNFDDSGFPLLQVDFTASTFRLLSEDERSGEAGADGQTRRSGRGGRR